MCSHNPTSQLFTREVHLSTIVSVTYRWLLGVELTMFCVMEVTLCVTKTNTTAQFCFLDNSNVMRNKIKCLCSSLCFSYPFLTFFLFLFIVQIRRGHTEQIDITICGHREWHDLFPHGVIGWVHTLLELSTNV